MKISKFMISLLAAAVLLSLSTSSVEGGNSNQVPESSTIASIVDQTDSCDPDAMGEKIKQKATTLSDNVCNTSEIANADNTGFFTDKQKDFYEKQCDRSKDLVNDPKSASKFAEIGKGKKDSSCYVVEIDSDDIGDNDGICTQSEKIKGGCQEAIEDGTGNDNGICEEVESLSDAKGKKIKTWETCDEVCIVSEDEVGDDCSQLEAMDGYLEDTNDELVELNAQTSAMLQELAQQKVIATEIENTTGEEEDNCHDLLLVTINDGGFGPYSSYSGNVRHNTYADATTANFWNEKLTLVTNLCTDIAGTNKLGNNALFVCALFHLAQWGTSDVLSSMSLLDDEITATRIDNMAACMEQMSQTNANTQAKLDEIITLLNTPQGQRNAFPTK